MQPNVWSACSSGTCVEVKWVRACSSGSCVEVGWVSACGSGSCVEVSHLGDRVLVRDSKLGEESPVIEFTPAGWRSFSVVAEEWNREETVLVSGGRLMNTRLIGSDLPVCLAAEPDVIAGWPRHLHFSWEEWDSFVEGVRAGKFEVKT